MANRWDDDPALAEFRAAKSNAERDAASIRALQAAPRPGVGPTRPTAPLWPETIRRHYFPSRKGALNAFLSNPVDVAKLSATRRKILTLLCEVELDGAFYANAGLPPDLRSRRRLLGLDPPSILEDCVAGKPRWQIVKEAFDRYRRLKAPALPLQAWLAKEYFDLDALRWVELWSEVQCGAYKLMDSGEGLRAALAALSPQQRHAWADRWLDEILRSPDRYLNSFINLLAESFRWANEAVPARFTAAMKLGPAPETPVKSPPKRKVRGGKYIFSGRNFGTDEFESLSPVGKKQFLVAAAKYAGKSFRTAKAFDAWGKEQLDGDIVDVKRYAIVLASAKSKPIYEMWTFLVDNGTVFATGSAKPIGVHMVQGHFQPEDKRAESRQLADELQADVPF